MAKFLKAKQSEMKNIVVEEETTKRENRFAKFVRVKRKAPEPPHRAKKPKVIIILFLQLFLTNIFF